MIKFRLKQLIAEKEFRDRSKIGIKGISEETGIARSTLSRIANVHGYSTTTDVLDKLCGYFECKIEDLMEYVTDSDQS